MIYTAFGLTIDSEISLPQLLPATGDVQVHVRYGNTPRTLAKITEKGVLYELNDDEFLFWLDGVARYYLKNGEEITVEREVKADDSSVQLFLLGSTMAALLHQRGLLPLHASAIETEQGAVLFTGSSGVGKSTTAAAFVRHGYRLLCDDISAIGFDADGHVIVYPAYPQQKLWADVLEELELGNEFSRVRPQLQKFSVPVNERFCDSPLPLHSIYILQPGNGSGELEELEGMWRIPGLQLQVYRDRFMKKRGRTVEHMKLFAAIANQCRIRILRRPTYSFDTDGLLQLIEDDMRA